MRRAVIRKKGPIIEVSKDGVRPLAMKAYKSFLGGMEYRHVKHLFGKEIIVEVDRETGHKHVTRVLVEDRRLYRFDAKGRLMCGSGYVERVYAALKARGYEVGFIDLDPLNLKAEWDRLDRHPEFVPTDEDKATLAGWLANGGVPDDQVPLVRRVKQEEIIRIATRKIDKGLGFVIQAPPGLGKSILMVLFPILYRKAKIAIVVPGQDNFFKTIRHLTRYIPSVGAVGHTKKSFAKVTVYSLASVHHIPDDTDIILVDEVHTAMAEAACQTLATVAPRAIRGGFTATPKGRMADARMEGMFGPVVYKMDWPEATKLNLVVPIEVRWLDGNFDQNPARGLDATARKRAGLWAHEARNKAFAAAARRHEDDQVLVMVGTIEHALRMSQVLPEYSLVYGQQDLDYFEKFDRKGLIAQDFAPVSREAREEMRQAFETGALKKVIATGVWSTGVSFDALQVLFLAGGGSSEILDEQIPGRVSRTHTASGKNVGIVYDCNDLFDPGFRAAAARRRSHYEALGWRNINPARSTTLAV